MSTKTDVKWFLNQCSNKAQRSIMEKAEKEIRDYLDLSGSEAYNNFKNKLELASITLNETLKYLNSSNTPFTKLDIFELLTKGNWDYGRKDRIAGTVGSNYTTFYNRIYPDFSFRDFLRFSYETKTDRTLCSLIDVKVKELLLVTEEYYKIKKQIEPLSVAQSIKYLAELGFDVSVLKVSRVPLETTAKIDTSLIFVCGDNK